MIKRICHFDSNLEDSIFLFGARQTGKSTFLRQTFPDNIYIDLLDTAIKGRFRRHPALLYEMLSDTEKEHWSSSMKYQKYQNYSTKYTA